jgi:hypothetical protein
MGLARYYPRVVWPLFTFKGFFFITNHFFKFFIIILVLKKMRGIIVRLIEKWPRVWHVPS